MKTSKNYRDVLLALMVLSNYLFLNTVTGQDFVNGNFEESSTCDVDDCNDWTISCIDGWWDWNGTDPDLFAWFKYECNYMPEYIDCDNINKRGLYLQGAEQPFGDLSVDDIIVATTNPVYGDNPNAVYKLDFDLSKVASSDYNPWLTIYGSHYPTAGNGSNKLKTTPTPSYGCTHFTLFFDHGITYNDERITEYEYLVFEVDWSVIPQPPSSAPDLRAVLDNVTICKAMEVQFHNDCKEPCISFKYYDECFEDVCGSECVLQLKVFKGEENEFYSYYENVPLTNLADCFEIPTSIDDVDVAFGSSHGNSPVGFNLLFNQEIEDCANLDITTNTTWSSASPPPYDHFDILTVKEGKTLTINGDIDVNFCNDGVLIVEPNARLNLYGTLTSNCPAGWKGVEIQGDATHGQYKNNITDEYYQGRLYCYENSLIENAAVAAKLWGPEFSDAGGVIYATGAFFKNNRKGVFYAPYTNFLIANGTQKEYFGEIRDCEFIIDQNYSLDDPFEEHIRMEGVFGVSIKGTYFINNQILESPTSPKEYGIGIHAINSGFNVGPSATNIVNEPCFEGACKRRTKFEGLGLGVTVNRFLRNRPFSIYNSIFSGCFFGINNSGVSGATILFNEFNFGMIKELEGDENQIGITMEGYQMFGSIQENTFETVSGNADFTMGISCQNTGETINPIRKNYFTNLDVGNEASGINGSGSDEGIRGLNYICNENTGVDDKDFYVVDTEELDYISFTIGQHGGPNRASGNIFSGTGNSNDGYFANYGELLSDYLYYSLDPNQVPNPNEIVGINPVDRDLGDCSKKYCVHPCISSAQDAYSNLNGLFDDYNSEMSSEDYEGALSYRAQIDSLLNNVQRFHELDTANFNKDTLRAWNGRVDAVVGQLSLAKDYLLTGNYTSADQVIDNIIANYPLTTYQEVDMNRVIRIISILSARSIYALTTSDIDTLELYSAGSGESYVIARSILSSIGYTFTPIYYVPGEINPRSIVSKSSGTSHHDDLILYPNPTSDELNILSNQWNEELITYSICDMNGKQLISADYFASNKKIHINLGTSLTPGVYILKVTDASGRKYTSRFSIIK